MKVRARRLALAFASLLLALLPRAAQGASPLEVVISEIAWMGTTTSHTDEWIELYNNTTDDVDLSGWTLAAAIGHS